MPRSNRIRRVLRYSIWGGLAIGVILALLAALLVYRPTTFAFVLERSLGKIIGGDVEIDRIAWMDGGDVALGGMSVRVPGLDGPAGEVIVIDDMTLRWSYRQWGFLAESLVIHDATVRLVEQGDWELTLGGLHPDGARDITGGMSPESVAETALEIPRISIESMRLVSGELVEGHYGVTGEATFTGEISPLADDSGTATFSLREKGRGGASFAGTIDPADEHLFAAAEGVSLGPDSQSLVPFRSLRRIARQLELKGEVTIEMYIGRNTVPSASMDLLSLSLRLDPAVFGETDGTGFWKMYRNGQVDAEAVPPILFVDSGWMEFRGDTFRISGAEGYIDAGERWIDAIKLPYHVDLEVSQLPDIGSMDDMEQAAGILAGVPFDLEVTAHDFSFEPDRGAVVPAEMARILKMFEVSQCDVDMALVLGRQETGGAVEASGTLKLADGRGAYENFPYPLHNLNAEIKLQGDDILVETLNAEGSANSQVGITGRVEASRGIDLAVGIFAENVPLDEYLLDAVPPRAEATLREVFSSEHINEPASESSRHQRVDLSLLVEQREIPAPPGGSEDYELSIRGTIPFEDLQITWAEFPVTLDLKKGWLRWADDMMYLEQEDGEPIAIETAQGGGRGTLAGAIHIPEGDGPGGGWIDFAVEDEQIDTNLLAALHHVSRGETEPLSQGGLDGLLEASGHIQIDGTQVDYDVSTMLRRGSLAVTPSLVTMVGLDLEGPLGGMDLLHLDGSIQLSSERGLVFNPMLVRAGEVDAQIAGTLDGGTGLKVDATGLHVGRWVLDFTSTQWRDRLSELWTVRNPEGHFAISATLTPDPQAQTRLAALEIVDLDVALEPTQRVLLRDGAIRIADDAFDFNSVRFAVLAPGQDVSNIEVRGTAHMGDGESDLRIDSEHLEVQTPLFGDAVALLAGPEGDETWQSLQPRGVVSMHAAWQRARNRDTWGVDILPREVSALWGETRLHFVDGGGSLLRLQPDEIRIERLAGSASEMEVAVVGAMRYAPKRISIGGSCSGSLGSKLLRTLAGPAWSRVLEDIEFADQGLTRIDGLHVDLEEGAGGWSGALSGEIALNEAALTTGIRLTKVSADVEAAIEFVDDQPLIDLVVRNACGLAIKAPFRDIRGRIVTDAEQSTRLMLDDLVGELGGGLVVVDGLVDPDAWQVGIAVANARLAKLFPSPPEASGEAPTGEVDAALHLRGRPGHPEALAGTGSFRVSCGHLRTLPALVAIQQVMHLSSPVVGALSFVDVDFVIQGGTAMLETIMLASGPTGQGGFSLVGDGTLEIETMLVEADLRPRGAWPIVSDVIGAIQDQLYEVRMTGHIGDPEVGFQAFPGLLGGGGGR
ncbi:MAG: hypothetical protein QF561_04415 [Phycisphaerales bacterium]|jgi:hypothetical protein|nr:hypothetical protein [Phycisphaerales bacterium]